MLETFLVLLAGGIMLAIAIPDPRDVTLNWLRLGGILALVFAGLSAFWHLTRSIERSSQSTLIIVMTLAAILAQLAFAQIARREAQRFAAALAMILATVAGSLMVHRPAYAVAGIGAMCGIVLMDMLIGHAYLTASKMTMAPFQRLNVALAVALLIRVGCNIFAAQREPYWGRDGLLIGTRWFVGLLVPAVFIYMAHDCIKRRSTQSATGILYVAGVLIFIGEIIALQLVRETGLPW